VRGGERPRLVLPNLVSGSAQDSSCELAITSTRYRTVPVMTEQFVWPAQILLDGMGWCRTLAVVSGR
jgi:hypothetical protein